MLWHERPSVVCYCFIKDPSGLVRTVFVHPSVDGSMERICTLPEVERVSRWRACRRKGMSEQLRALYSLLGARKHPRGAQEQIGADAVAALLLGGSGAALAASPPLASPPPVTQQASGATQASGAASGVAPDVPAAASSSAPAAAIPAAIAPQGFCSFSRTKSVLARFGAATSFICTMVASGVIGMAAGTYCGGQIRSVILIVRKRIGGSCLSEA